MKIDQTPILAFYTLIFFAGVARAFADPASTAMESQVVPKHLAVSAASWISSTWISCLVLGPAAIGFVYDAVGATRTYFILAFCFLLSWICTLNIQPQEQIKAEKSESILKSIGIGWKFVFSHPPFWGAMTLDLFAVMFGGGIAILPIFAQDILHVGAKGLGLLNAAPSLGALLITLMATHRPPIAKAGRNLIFAVIGFGMSFIIFAFSKNFWLSMAALFASGVFDGISMVIRRSMIRLLSPDHLRGRIAAANFVFICASNELGAFESGFVAAWIGAIPCIALGGLVTLGIASLMTWVAPELMRLRFNPNTLERE